MPDFYVRLEAEPQQLKQRVNMTAEIRWTGQKNLILEIYPAALPGGYGKIGMVIVGCHS